VVDAAAPRLLVEEHAGLLEDRVLDAPQHALARLDVDLRVAALGRLGGDVEVPRQTVDVARRDLHAVVDRAAEGRALVAVEVDARLFVLDRFNHYLLKAATGGE
jgi:hypothetical protein